MSQKRTIQQRLQRIRTLTLFMSIGTLTTLALLLTFVPVDEKVEARGRVHAERETYVRSVVEGVVKEINVHVGDSVGADQVLARLDSTEAEGRLEMTDARITQARAELELKQTQLEAALKSPLPKEFRHSHEEREAAAKRKEQAGTDLERIRALGKSGAVSQRYVETAELEFAVASAELEKAERTVRIVEAGLEKTLIDQSRAEVHAAKEALGILEVERHTLVQEIARHTIRAPEAGVVTLVLRRTVGEKVTKGADLFHLSHGEPTQVDLYATEREYHRIDNGQPVIMTSPAFNRLKHGYIEGRVIRRAIEAEEEVPAGYEAPVYRVTVLIEKTPQPLTLGTSIDAEIILARNPLWRLVF